MCSSIKSNCRREMNHTLNIPSWNVKGLNKPVKSVFSHIKQLEIGNAFLQETHICNSDINHLMTRWAGQHSHSAFQAKLRGVSIFINTVVEKLFRVPFEFNRILNIIISYYQKMNQTSHHQIFSPAISM